MEIRYTDRVKNQKDLQRVKEERNILHEAKEGRLTGSVTRCVGTAL